MQRGDDLQPGTCGGQRCFLHSPACGIGDTIKLHSQAMAQRLVLSGFDPADTLAALGLPAIDHTGLPSAQLQQVQMVDPENPDAAYPAK